MVQIYQFAVRSQAPCIDQLYVIHFSKKCHISKNKIHVNITQGLGAGVPIASRIAYPSTPLASVSVKLSRYLQEKEKIWLPAFSPLSKKFFILSKSNSII